MTRYTIYELSARAVMSYAEERDGVYVFQLDRRATERCRVYGARHEQDANALFFQTMCVLNGNDYREQDSETAIPDLAGVIFYMDFAQVFNRNGTSKRRNREWKARDMFRPEGVTLDFGDGPMRFLPFERSGNMSRQMRLSFIRADVHDEVRRRIMLGMEIGICQLSKLYAYNGLMLSGGVRIDGIEIDRPGRVIVLENDLCNVHSVPVVTVVDDDAGSESGVHRYRRVEARKDLTVAAFDGEGLISKEYAAAVDKAYCGKHIHSSFQIRMPYIKGMLHQVDFKSFCRSTGTETLTDIWGVEHRVEDVDIILTRTMFKGCGWLNENHMSWSDYWAAFRRYRHALYIVNVNKEKPERTTELNYQFLSTVPITAEEFRPADLPEGWDHSPAEDTRHWLTKETELAYYNLCADRQYRLDYFLEPLKRTFLFRKSRKYLMAEVLKRNPLFIDEPVFADELAKKAEAVLRNFSTGRLIVAGDNRYLSGDLLDFLERLVDVPARRTWRQNRKFIDAFTGTLRENDFYAPGAAYEQTELCTLLRNPHIARNEELLMSPADSVGRQYKKYLGHLTDVVMVSAFMLAAERLGGADYDGDMVKTIADPILNRCVRRNYGFDLYGDHVAYDNMSNLPLLLIPDAEPRLRDAGSWHDRYETVRDTFSSRVGQICNAALNRSVVAYNENSDADERARCREETETLAILTGLEIDSAKTGVSPDLSAYLNSRSVKRSPFLKYKSLMDEAEQRRAWYEPTHREKLKRFFAETDWDGVDSNVERLPLIAKRLKEQTRRIKPRPAPDDKLFVFAQAEGWKKKLDGDIRSAVSALLEDYEACLDRIRACRVPPREKSRKSDIERTLYARGQDERYDTDELYARFQRIEPGRITELRRAVRAQGWHLMDPEERERFLLEYLPELPDLHDFLSDFRNGGFRILGDLVSDIDEENRGFKSKQLFRDGDSDDFTAMMLAYVGKPFTTDYKRAVSDKCRELLDRIVEPGEAVRYVVALGKRRLLWDLLLDHIRENTLKAEASYAE